MAFSDGFPALDAQKNRILETEEKARACKELFFFEAAKALLAGVRSTDKEEVLPVFKDFIAQLPPLSHLHLAALSFAQRLQERFGALPVPEGFSQAPLQEICYVKNPYVQRVIDLSGLRVRWFYADDFDGACSQVADGQRDACILPYLDAEGRPMPGIERLISDYGLKKQRLFRFDFDGRSGGCLLLTADARVPDAPALIELQLFPENRELLFEAVCLLRSSDVRFLPPVPLQRGEDFENPPLSCSLSLEVNGALPSLPLYALSLLVPDMSVTGCYDVVHLTDD